MRLVILESPYAGEVERNVLYARRAIRHSLAQGEAPIASHLLYTQPGVLHDSIPHERDWGIAAGLAWRRVCPFRVFYIDYGMSGGMRHAEAQLRQELTGVQFAQQVEYRKIGENP